jgi:hypothetical protein
VGKSKLDITIQARRLVDGQDGRITRVRVVRGLVREVMNLRRFRATVSCERYAFEQLGQSMDLLRASEFITAEGHESWKRWAAMMIKLIDDNKPGNGRGA